jgi:hypothetical protein
MLKKEINEIKHIINKKRKVSGALQSVFWYHMPKQSYVSSQAEEEEVSN